MVYEWHRSGFTDNIVLSESLEEAQYTTNIEQISDDRDGGNNPKVGGFKYLEESNL